MTEDRIPTELWVTAHLRQLTAKGIHHYIVHKGAPAAGTVVVKIVMAGQGCKLYNQSRDIDGNMGWMDIFDGSIVEEPKADEYLQRALKRDPDVWIVEVEDKTGQNPFEGRIF